jgi:hypothetical protein
MSTQSNEDIRLNETDLAIKIQGRALNYLKRLRITVFRRSALNNVRNENVFSWQPNPFQETVQDFPRSSYKWDTFNVLPVAWGLADKHNRCINASLSWHSILTLNPQGTLDADSNIFGNLLHQLRFIQLYLPLHPK